MKSELVRCFRCFGKGRYNGVYGITVCLDCDGTGRVSKEKRKKQLKANRELIKQLNQLKNK